MRLHACNSLKSEFMHGRVPAWVDKELQVSAVGQRASPAAIVSFH
jgi:hypothetical protein